MSKKKVSKQKQVLQLIGRLTLKIVIIFFLISVVGILALKWIDPLTSSIMIQRKISSIFSSDKERLLSYKGLLAHYHLNKQKYDPIGLDLESFVESLS